VLLDAPEGGAGSALHGLDRLPHPPAVVLLAAGAPRAPSAAALRAGVRAVLPLDATGAEILAAVEAAAAGLVTLRPASVGELRNVGAVDPSAARAAPGRARDLDRQPLTARETEILAMMAEGLGNKLIAARLGISGHTVKFHVASIFGKLAAGSRTEAVTIGLRRGLILI
jgi:NarL family two-component system response regulator YdfI